MDFDINDCISDCIYMIVYIYDWASTPHFVYLNLNKIKNFLFCTSVLAKIL